RTPRNPTIYTVSFMKHIPYLKTLKNSRPLPDFEEYACKVIFSEHDSEITKDGKVIGRGIRKSGLYVMKLRKNPKDKICLTTIVENSTLWHRKLGHANMHLIQSLTSKELVRNLPKLKFDQHFCNACKIGKQAHVSHKAKNIVSTTRCLKLLHMDLFGPSTVRSYGGNLYTLVIVDDYSRQTIDHSAGGKLRDRNAEESWTLLEDLALYDNKSWNNPKDFAKPVKAIYLPQDVPSTPDYHLIELKNQVQRLMEAHLAPKQSFK
ncbi:retrovirus-related pol polyprotein from transposon TNT 1-94, partial [Tanacetum coccineum]